MFCRALFICNKQSAWQTDPVDRTSDERRNKQVRAIHKPLPPLCAIFSYLSLATATADRRTNRRYCGREGGLAASYDDNVVIVNTNDNACSSQDDHNCPLQGKTAGRIMNIWMWNSAGTFVDGCRYSGELFDRPAFFCRLAEFSAGVLSGASISMSTQSCWKCLCSCHWDATTIVSLTPYNSQHKTDFASHTYITYILLAIVGRFSRCSTDWILLNLDKQTVGGRPPRYAPPLCGCRSA